MLVKLPGTVRRLRIVRPLLVYECSGICKNAMIKLRVIPSHDQGARTSRAAAHGCTRVRILSEFDVSLALHQGQNFALHKLGINSGHCVVLKTAFTPLRVSAAVADG